MQQQTQYGQGTEVVVPDSDVLAAYEQSGYQPGSPSTDQGWTVEAALGYLKTTGMSGHTIAGYGQLTVSSVDELKTAIDEFGGVDFGVNLPNSAMDQFNAGQDWDVVANDGGIDGGHCICSCGYNSTGIQVWTWGKLITMTWAFAAKYARKPGPRSARLGERGEREGPGGRRPRDARLGVPGDLRVEPVSALPRTAARAPARPVTAVTPCPRVPPPQPPDPAAGRVMSGGPVAVG